MNFPAIFHVLGALLIFIGCAMLLPLSCALIYNEGDAPSLAISMGVTLAIGLSLWWSYRKYRDLTLKDGFFIVTFGWILV